ncbi:hypothetical protein [Gabonibacter massiliensis]|uniref:hypothetical protein n=1 Tax=Gabonibacter massiliensis TaxID=1720195 RepID=UPI0011CA5CF6|nr:hypothetical protein [Gabonibacter massiliensis]
MTWSEWCWGPLRVSVTRDTRNLTQRWVSRLYAFLVLEKKRSHLRADWMRRAAFAEMMPSGEFRRGGCQR